MKIGDKLKLKREYCDNEEDGRILYEVLEINGDRLLVRGLIGWSLEPTYVYPAKWFIPAN